MDVLQLHGGEQIVVKLRKHPLIIVGKLIPYAILDYLPYLVPKVGTFIASMNPGAAVDYVAQFSFDNPWVRFIVGIYWLYVWMGAFGTFINYYLDQWVVTNERIIEITQQGFFSRKIDSLFLNRVQDVESHVEGFFHTLFGFGIVSVESAGPEQNRVQMSGLGNPESIRDTILKLTAKLEGLGELKNVGS